MILFLIRTFRPSLILPELPVPFSAEEYKGRVGSARHWNVAFEDIYSEGVFINERYNNITRNCMYSAKHYMYIISCDPPGPGKWVLLLFPFSDGENKAQEKGGNPNKATQELKSRAGA